MVNKDFHRAEPQPSATPRLGAAFRPREFRRQVRTNLFANTIGFLGSRALPFSTDQKNLAFVPC
jgi:hypothetical protein